MSDTVKLNEIVTLLGVSQTNEASVFQLVNPNGTLSPFVIPEDRVFVVTDMDFIFGNAAPNRTTTVQLLLFDGGPLSAFQNATIADSAGVGGFHSSLTTGVVIARNTPFTVRATSDINPAGVRVNLHGYFAKFDD